MQKRGESLQPSPEDFVDDDLSDIPSRHRRLLETHVRAMTSYAPQVYDGRITLFRVRRQTISEALFGSIDPKLGWEDLAIGGVEVKTVAGSHHK